MSDFQVRSPAVVKAVIAAAVLPPPDHAEDRLGEVVLRRRQRIAADRLISLIREHGGALLADPVGLGKTYAALAVSRGVGGTATVIAPASLREMWRASIAACHADAIVVSHESLSRGVSPALSSGLVIVDEAHRFRSASTRRYALLGAALGKTPLLLVSATPLQNRRSDLASQLALFLGRRAWMMSDEELAAYVVRTSDADADNMPELNGPVPISLASDDDCLDQILALPPPIAARDESVAVSLLTYGLVHQWSSSRAALVAALRRRRSRGMALLAAFDAGRYPTRAELSAWTHLDDAVQLAFPELVVAASTPSTIERDDLAVAVDRYVAGVEALLERCRAAPDPDDERASLLAHLMDVHRGERIIAFCQYAETVEALRRRLSSRAGIATLTARGARVAGGRVSRDTVLAQFLPTSSRIVDASRRIDLLIATDLLSEGLNLQEASVVVHLDLPWNPARLDQRVGRARRLGSRHRVVTVYSFSPPTSAERMLRIHERLREKLKLAQRAVGVAGRILPAFVGSEPRATVRSFAEQSSVVDGSLREWVSAVPVESCPVVCAVSAPIRGFLAACRVAGVARMVVDVGQGPTDDPAAIARAIAVADGAQASCDARLVTRILDRIAAHLSGLRADASIDFAAAANAHARRAALARVARTLARTPRHRRPLIASLADAARAVAMTTLGEGAERILATLVDSDLPDEAWLRSIATFGRLNARPRTTRDATVTEVVGLIVFVSTAESQREGEP